MGWFEPQSKASAWLLANPVVAWMATALGVFIAATAGPLVFADEPEAPFGWFSAFAILFMAYIAFVTIAFPRIFRQRPHEVLAPQWAFSLGPVLIGFVAVVIGAERWFAGLGGLLSVGSLTFVMLWARRTARSSPDPPNPSD